MGHDFFFDIILPNILHILTLVVSGLWALLWKELRNLKAAISHLEETFTFQSGLQKGQDHEERILRLERTVLQYHPGSRESRA